MTSIYHFNCGESTGGPIGLCANIVAESPEAAVERLKSMLPESWDTDIQYDLTPESMEGPYEYIAVYFGDTITVADIDDVTEIPAFKLVSVA